MNRLATPTATYARREPWRRLPRIMALILLIAAVIAFFATGAERLLSLDALRANEHWLTAAGARHPLLFAGAFLLTYVAVTGLSVPGALPLTVAGGALFGLVEGTLLVSFAASLGALLAFLATRLLFRDFVRRKFARRLDQINRGIERDGSAYLLSLRLVPAVPFVLVNISVRRYPLLRVALLLAQPAWHAARDDCVRECRNPAEPHPKPVRYPVSCHAGVAAAARSVAPGSPRLVARSHEAG